MGRKVQEACAECTQKCRFFHGKDKSSSPVPTSFFKIMVGDDFSRYLYIPPKFNRTVSALLDNKVTLKDSSGKQWVVTISLVNSSLAFKEGWNAFSSDHGLEVGDFLLFNYINDYFDVSIFDRSGCERLGFSNKRNNKKRGRDRSGSPVRDSMSAGQGSYPSIVSNPDVPKMKCQHREVDLGGIQNNIENISNHDNTNGRAQSVCIAEHCEDPCYMTSRDFGGKERDDKNSMFDVLDCEIWNNCSVDGTGKVTTGDLKVPHVDYGSHVYQNDAIVCNKDPLFEGILLRGCASDPSEFELFGRSNSLREKDKSAYDKTSALKLEENREYNSIISNRKVQECQFGQGLESEQVVISKREHALHIAGFHNTKQMFNGIPNISDANYNGEMLKMFEKKHVDMTSNSFSFKDKLHATGEMSKGIKKELVDMTPNPNAKDELGATEYLTVFSQGLALLVSNNYTEIHSIMSDRKVQECQFAEGLEGEQVISKKEHALRTEGFLNTKQMFNGIPSNSGSIHNGEMLKMSEKKQVDMTPNSFGFKDKLHATDEMSEGIKKEPVDIPPNAYKDELLATGLSKVIKGESGQSSHKFNQDNESHFQTAATISCVVPPDNDSFLELPAPLPLSHRGRVKMERMVVYLRDRQLRGLWPVLYHERSSLKILTNGWLEFRRANNIQPSDVCIFGVENESKRIFAVDVVHK